MIAAQVTKAGYVRNVIVVADDFTRKTWDGMSVIYPADSAAIGDKWDGAQFLPAPPPPPPVKTRLDVLIEKADTLTPLEQTEALSLLLKERAR